MSDQKFCVYITERTLNCWSHGNQMNFNWWLHIRQLSLSSCSVLLLLTAGGLPVCAGLFLSFYTFRMSPVQCSDSWFQKCFVAWSFKKAPAWHNVTLMAWCTSLCTLYRDISDKTGLNLGCQSMTQSPVRGFLGTETTAPHKTSPVPPPLPPNLLWTNMYKQLSFVGVNHKQ